MILSEISSTDTKGNGSTTETAESGVEELSEKSNFFSPATASQSKEEETTRKSSLKTAFSSSFVDPFSLSISITKEFEEEKEGFDDDSDDDFDVEEYEVTLG